MWWWLWGGVMSITGACAGRHGELRRMSVRSRLRSTSGRRQAYPGAKAHDLGRLSATATWAGLRLVFSTSHVAHHRADGFVVGLNRLGPGGERWREEERDVAVETAEPRRKRARRLWDWGKRRSSAGRRSLRLGPRGSYIERPIRLLLSFSCRAAIVDDLGLLFPSPGRELPDASLRRAPPRHG